MNGLRDFLRPQNTLYGPPFGPLSIAMAEVCHGYFATRHILLSLGAFLAKSLCVSVKLVGLSEG